MYVGQRKVAVHEAELGAEVIARGVEVIAQAHRHTQAEHGRDHDRLFTWKHRSEGGPSPKRFPSAGVDRLAYCAIDTAFAVVSGAFWCLV
jgi:hypothetical protein